MPITLPNSGLVCPEASDPHLQACEQIKALFTYVDSLPTTSDIEDNPCVQLASLNWVSQGPADCKEFKQTVNVPIGVNPYKSSISIIDANGAKVYLCIENVSVTTVCVYTNTPDEYQMVFS